MKISYRAGAIIALVISFSFNPVYAQLPPEVQVDLLKEQIVDSLRAKDYNSVKEKILEYKSLGVAVPPAILLINAKISIQEEDFLKGQSALEEYFNASGKEHELYREALSLYKSVQPKAQAERDRQWGIQLRNFSSEEAARVSAAKFIRQGEPIITNGKLQGLTVFHARLSGLSFADAKTACSDIQVSHAQTRCWLIAPREP